jgi:hypothetical protein
MGEGNFDRGPGVLLASGEDRVAAEVLAAAGRAPGEGVGLVQRELLSAAEAEVGALARCDAGIDGLADRTGAAAVEDERLLPGEDRY